MGSGGTLAALSRGVLASGWGVDVPNPPEHFEEWVQEHRCGALVEVPVDRLSELELPGGCMAIGKISEKSFSIRIGETNILSEQAISAWRDTYENSLN